jgi:hypothetical protein
MGQLIRYLDGKTGCWSRVDLENGDPIWISVAQDGVVVKKSKMSFLGSTLYKEAVVYQIAKTAEALDFQNSKSVSNELLPAEMKNLVLRAFTQAVLGCRSASHVSVLLNEALKYIEDSYSRWQIISQYHNYTTQNWKPLEIRDASELPHPKAEILDAITQQIKKEHNELRVLTLKIQALMLAEFQENIGSTPLKVKGTSISERVACVTNRGQEHEDQGWKDRRLCPDESCIGVIGKDGVCSECGKIDRDAIQSTLPDKTENKQNIEENESLTKIFNKDVERITEMLRDADALRSQWLDQIS